MAQTKTPDRRAQQLEQTGEAIETLNKTLQTVRKKQAREGELASHLSGFYEEIDKLTKGKALVEVTDLIVVQANDVIRDAKSIIESDIYLDRIKEFVPAGTNPVYPDVLLILRAVQQSLERSRAQSEQRRNHLANLLVEAKTIHGALTCLIGYKVSSPLKEQVEKLVDGPIANKWFPGTYASGFHFDFARLDFYVLKDYLSEHRGIQEPEE
ncbi:MAG TPA: hypothetical protein VH024_18210 [Candidatus Angelobacter sp.]|jgi:hypothetical protein|nr:hypothetical protein [Candidatus Angelobacter sp.]